MNCKSYVCYMIFHIASMCNPNYVIVYFIMKFFYVRKQKLLTLYYLSVFLFYNVDVRNKVKNYNKKLIKRNSSIKNKLQHDNKVTTKWGDTVSSGVTLNSHTLSMETH